MRTSQESPTLTEIPADRRWMIATPDGERMPIDRKLVIGRLPDCDVTLTDTLVSGRHLSVEPSGDAVSVTDLDSTNGTYIDSTRLHGATRLTEPTTVVVGATPITIGHADDLRSPCWIVVEDGPSAGVTHELPEGGHITIGRDASCTLVVDDPLVSNRHLRISRAPLESRATLLVEDLASANGTFVNDSPLAPHTATRVEVGDRLQIGDSTIVLSETRSPPAPRRETVIRTVPTDLKAAAAAATTGASQPPSSRSSARRPFMIAGGVGVVVVAIAIAVFALVPRGNDETGTVQSIVESQSPRTVQLIAELADGAGSGSGVVIDAERGLVLTNSHVIGGSDALQVKLPEGDRVVDASIFASMPCEDLALVQIDDPADRQGLTAATLAGADQLEVGEQVVALGFPGSAESASSPAAFATDQLSATEGIISKTSAKYIDPTSGVAPLEDTIQHTAAINHGNSGGPLFDLDGNLVGINTALFADQYGQRLEGVNYAVSSVRISALLDRLFAGEAPGEFGLSLIPAWERGENLPSAVEIVGVGEGSAADRAGIATGTYVVEADGKEVTDLVTYCGVVADGDAHTLTIYDQDRETSRDHELEPGVW